MTSTPLSKRITSYKSSYHHDDDYSNLLVPFGSTVGGAYNHSFLRQITWKGPSSCGRSVGYAVVARRVDGAFAFIQSTSSYSHRTCMFEIVCWRSLPNLHATKSTVDCNH